MENQTTPVLPDEEAVGPNEAVEESKDTPSPTTSVGKSTRKTREKVRPMSVLTDPNTPVKSLSEKEKILLIEQQKADINKLTHQIEAYRRNSEEAFKKAQLFENRCKGIADAANLKFNDIIQAVSVLYKTVYLIAKDGTNND